MILTDKEIIKHIDASTEYDYVDYDSCETLSTFDVHPLLKAQLKKVVGWGEEECAGHEGYQYSLQRRQCSECWQSLLKEVEDAQS